jgi:hypothetical protein
MDGCRQTLQANSYNTVAAHAEEAPHGSWMAGSNLQGGGFSPVVRMPLPTRDPAVETLLHRATSRADAAERGAAQLAAQLAASERQHAKVTQADMPP